MFASLKVDHPIGSFVTATTVPHGDTTVIVSPAGFGQPERQLLDRFAFPKARTVNRNQLA